MFFNSQMAGKKRRQQPVERGGGNKKREQLPEKVSLAPPRGRADDDFSQTQQSGQMDDLSQTQQSDQMDDFSQTQQSNSMIDLSQTQQSDQMDDFSQTQQLFNNADEQVVDANYQSSQAVVAESMGILPPNFYQSTQVKRGSYKVTE